MKRVFDSVTVGVLMALALIQSCTSEPPLAPPPAAAPATPKVNEPEPPAYPPPPPLAADASGCVVRRFQEGKVAWDVDIYEYDAAQRTIGRRMHFDSEGRITRWDMSDTFRTYTYDSHGNLSEEANWKHDKVSHGQRWDNHYEGDPPRIVAIDVSDFRKPGQRRRPSMRYRYEYDAEGLIDVVTREWSGTERHLYTWQDDRIIAVYSSLGPRHPRDRVPYLESNTYEYDERGRLKLFTVDGMLPHGEGATADGKPDHVSTFSYDASGRLERMESDGWGGDVAPEAPDGKPDQITLFTPPCDPLVKLAPRLFGFPELHLPRSIAPPLR
jgi:YD repeat-containing protein